MYNFNAYKEFSIVLMSARVLVLLSAAVFSESWENNDENFCACYKSNHKVTYE